MAHSKKRPRAGVRPTADLGSAWVDEVLAQIPDVPEQVKQGLDVVRTQGFNESLARTELGRWIVICHRTIESVYRAAENSALEGLAKRWADGARLPAPGADVREWARDLLSRASADFRAFEFRAGQTRKSRAGSVWERLGHLFLSWNDIPNEKPSGQAAKKLRQIDRVVPSVQVALDDPDRAARLSFKTEAREKWRVLIDESRRGHVYLVTLGDDVTEDRIEEMADSRLVVYVPEAIKNSSSNLKQSHALRTLDELVGDLQRYVPAGPPQTTLMVQTPAIRGRDDVGL